MATAEEEKCCRYCFEGENVSKLISPCDCKGSAAYIHKQCVTRWMIHSESKTCELCQVEFRCKPSRWETFKKSMQRTKHEAICYSIIFAVFMLPVILFKSIADALRHTHVLTYEQADRLLTGGLFGTYLLLIVFGILFVAIWIHHCHDDSEADAVVAPIETASAEAHLDDPQPSVDAAEDHERETEMIEVVVHVTSSPVSTSAPPTDVRSTSAPRVGAYQATSAVQANGAIEGTNAIQSYHAIQGAGTIHALAAFLFHNRRRSNGGDGRFINLADNGFDSPHSTRGSVSSSPHSASTSRNEASTSQRVFIPTSPLTTPTRAATPARGATTLAPRAAAAPSSAATTSFRAAATPSGRHGSTSSHSTIEISLLDMSAQQMALVGLLG